MKLINLKTNVFHNRLWKKGSVFQEMEDAISVLLACEYCVKIYTKCVPILLSYNPAYLLVSKGSPTFCLDEITSILTIYAIEAANMH